ncbi:dephospho-CoA kinase [Flavobacterium sp. CYK-55]|uniref:dephospho-CoA kinase n=1 Tax=Flavobacterium sp. CYK-55 TaxID=2835529 RepID=UPI001BD16436|nr:dephospho-CoA kinase [Flavobacterium sp. CYK-55]MBS7786735.1 dephospho-CoA kinase [Flavobacterium sp. CYK-55]
MTKIIGLTGGIGSGKTTVAKQFMDAGIPVYIADEEAKKLLDSSDIQSQIKSVFGTEVFEDEKVLRSKLAQLVFNQPQKLKQLNAIIHPAVKEHFLTWLKSKQNEPYVIREAAILFESGTYQDCDLIISVVAPIEDRISRVMKRDHVDRAAVLSRINNQWTDEQRIEKSNFVIENISPENTYKQVSEILKKLTIV